MKTNVKKHLKENYPMYLIFVTMFFLVLIALQNHGLKNSGLSRKQRDEVNEMIKNAEMPKNNRKFIFYIIGAIIVAIILFYKFVLLRQQKIHQKIIQDIKSIRTIQKR